MRFGDRTAVITGASSGIGAAVARRLTDEGATVFGLDLEPPMQDAPWAHLHTDVADSASVAEAIGRVEQETGRVDVLVNNAAIARADAVEDISDDEWRREVAVALDGTFFTCRAVLPTMVRRAHGVIVNLSSISAQLAFGQEAYSAAKAGIVALTRNIAVRYGRSGIRANCVAPGTVMTPAWDARLAQNPHVFDQLATAYPLGRVGTPNDIAAAVSFLASDDASWITGTTLVVDGGYTAGGVGVLETAVGAQ